MPESVMRFIRRLEGITGIWWKWRGRRIRILHQNGVSLVKGIIFTSIFIAITALVVFFTSSFSIGFLILTIVITFLIGFFAFRLLAENLLVTYYERLVQKQQIARQIKAEGLYKEISVEKRKRIVGYPKVYYEVMDGHINVLFPVVGENQNKHLNMEKSLETALYAEVTDKISEKGYVRYKFLSDMMSQRINVDDIVCENGRMRLMKNKYWEFDELPHMLISGGTGGGKTFFILMVIKALAEAGADLKILDPKMADLSDLKAVFPAGTVYDTKDGMLMTLKKFEEEMMLRMQEMKTMPGYREGEGMRYSHLGLKPKFLIFDEYVAFYDSLEYAEKTKVSKSMAQLAMKGRQAGYFLIIGCQRPDSEYFGGGVRDQFMFRLTLGRMSGVGYRMMFGEVDKVFLNKEIKGRGYVDFGNGVISEFYSPFVPTGYSFYEKLKQLNDLQA